MRCIDTKRAYKELVEKEYFSMDRTNIKIETTNEIADIEKRDAVYREFLNMLKLELKHKIYLEQQGLLEDSIESQMYRSIPNRYINRLLIANNLKRKFDLAGVPGFYQQEDWNWNFVSTEGFFIPVFDENEHIQGLSIHLDNTYNDTTDIWFSSANKINGTAIKNILYRSNIYTYTDKVILTDDLLLGNLIDAALNEPVIAFSGISNAKHILKALENTNIGNIIFTIRIKKNQNLDYIIQRIFKDLVALGYKIDIKVIREYKEILNENSLCSLSLENVA